MRSILTSFGLLALNVCTACFFDGGQSGTESSDLEGTNASSGQQSAYDGSTSVSTNTGVDASVILVYTDAGVGPKTHFDSSETPERTTSAASSPGTDAATATSEHMITNGLGVSTNVAETSSGIELDSGVPTLFERAQNFNPLPAEPPTLFEPGSCFPTHTAQADNTYCTAYQACTNETYATECTEVDGAASCACRYASHGFLVNFPTYSSTLCEDIMDACREHDVTLGEVVCLAPVTRVENNVCDTQMACERPLSMGARDGTQSLRHLTSCIPVASGGMDCQCGVESVGTSTFHIDEEDPATACEHLVSVCNVHTQPASFTEAPVCRTEEQELPEGSGCDIRTDCVYLDSVDAQTVQHARGGTSVSCSGETSECRCGGMKMELLSTSVDSNLCRQLEDPCSTLRAEHVFQDAECTLSYRDNPAGSASFDCTRIATLAGISVLLHGGLYIGCTQQDAQTGWQCQCAGRVVTVEATKASDAIDVAFPRCQELAREAAVEALGE